MRQVQEVDLDMSRALIHVKNARRMAAASKQALVLSNLKVISFRIVANVVRF